jgi:hypothetical protein
MRLPSLAWGIYLKNYRTNLFTRVNPYEFAYVDMSSWSMTWCHVKRCLLTQLLETELGLPPTSIRGPDFILENRRHILQLFLPQEMAVDEEQSEPWPRSIWDSDAQLFFLSGGPHPDGAAAMTRIKASLSVPTA